MRFDGGNLSGNALVCCLLEESSLGLTKLVDKIYEKMRALEGCVDGAFGLALSCSLGRG